MKISVYIAASLDGFIAREDGGLDWLPGSDGQSSGADGEDFGFQAFMDSVDALVMGRNTFEMVHSFGGWAYGDTRVVVLSRTLAHLPPNTPPTVELQSGPLAELVAGLRQSGARHVYVDGGQTIQAFLQAGLVTNFIITTVPVLIGRGIPLFGPLAQDVLLRHVKTRTFANGFVQSSYRVASV
ncbi:MAG: dihydrofolate reductase [Chloroflexi bacterium]|nr:MAG: dihydrofolate reductase [Chloroflexota bacterium]